MKKRALIITTIIITIGLTAFGIHKRQFEGKECDVKVDETLFAQTDPAENVISFYMPMVYAPVNQDLFYMVRGRYDRPTTKEKLRMAKSLSDFIPNYPSSWIVDYTSVEIFASLNGEEMMAISENDVLNDKQKNLLTSIDLAEDILINVNYKSQNCATKYVKNRQMIVEMTVVPEKEAEFIGGYNKMITYLIENSKEEISENALREIQPSSILFTINEKGEVDNVELNKTTGDDEIDKFLVELIDKMPNWSPAENSVGSTVKQQFEFNLGLNGC